MSHTIEKITDRSAQLAIHMKLGKTNTELAEATHKAMCQDLYHASLHGDAGLCQDICNRFGLGNKYTAAKVAIMKEWFFNYSGKQFIVKTTKDGEKVWGMVKGWTAEKFDLEGAQSTPFWELYEDKVPQKFSLAAIFKMIEGIPGRIKSQTDNEKFAGDPVVATQFAAELVDFVKARKDKFTKEQTGELELAADALLAKQGKKPTVKVEEVPVVVTSTLITAEEQEAA